MSEYPNFDWNLGTELGIISVVIHRERIRKSGHFPKFHSNVRAQRLIGWHEIHIRGMRRWWYRGGTVNHGDRRRSCVRVLHVWVIERPRAAGRVSVRSLIGLHVRVPKRNTDFICPLVYASRPVGRRAGRRARRVEGAGQTVWSRLQSRLRSRKSKLQNRPVRLITDRPLEAAASEMSRVKMKRPSMSATCFRYRAAEDNRIRVISLH